MDKIWENEKERTAAIEEFREGLKSITTLDENKRNLIFIVDELDRCRPDYAIDLLEERLINGSASADALA